MAELLQCSRATIHSIESGRLRLSENLAERMFEETFISSKWLLEGDPKKPAITATGRPYTTESFEFAQAIRMNSDHVDDWQFAAQFLGWAGRLRSVLAHANQRKAYYMPAYKVGRFIDALAKEYGGDINASSNFDRIISAIKGDMQEFAKEYVTTAYPPTSERSPRRARKRKALSWR